MLRYYKIQQWKIDYIAANYQTPVRQIAHHLEITEMTVYKYLVSLGLDKTSLKNRPPKRPPAQYSNSLNINQYFEP